MTLPSSNIRIYVACLAAYNNGVLHGVWIDACRDVEEIWWEINAMLKSSPIPHSEEFAIHDYEGFEGAPIEEYSSVHSVHELAVFIEEHGRVAGKLVEYFGDLTSAKEAMEDRYAGVYSTVSDFAQDITEQSTEIPEALQNYIDYEQMARDMEINDILTIETAIEEVHIFWR